MEEILVSIHLLVLAFTVWQIIFADHLGLKWVRGRTKVLDYNVVHKYHRRILLGLVLMITTGAILFFPQKDQLLMKPQFIVKMCFVIALIINSFAIGVLQKVAATRTFAALSFKEKLPLFVTGLISTLSWIGATAGGFFLDSD